MRKSQVSFFTNLRRAAFLFSAVVGVSLVACGDNGGGTGNPSGTGGTASGGTPGKGGASASGGAASTGGVPGTGGATGANGGKAAGGAPGTGGSKASGGSTAIGGTTSSNPSGGITAGGGTSAGGGKAGSAGSVSTGGAGESGGTTAPGGSGGAGGETPRDGGAGRDARGAGGAGTGGSGAGGSTGGAIDGGPGGGAVPSSGCGKTPTLKNTTSTTTFNPNTLTVGGQSREFIMRWPDNYNNNTPHRLIFDLHGAGGSDKDHAKDNYMGLFPLSNGTTIFVALGAVGGSWSATADTTYVDEVLKLIENDLCIDTSRIMLEGFSMGGAMVAVLACGRPGVFRAAIGHSRGGVTAPTTCKPIPYLGSLGLSDISGNSQATQTDAFAKWNGCTVENLPTASTGSHICTNYKNCPAADPVVWCSYDGGHTYSPTDSGQRSSWMPEVAWKFFSQF
jgi:poly(3-hydroxybutyrate) depolymerase